MQKESKGQIWAPRWWAVLLIGLFAACGLSPGRRRGADRTRLTPQELSVARLVASGLTNREVGAELFLSTKTIEFHLSQIFTKLDITSRRQIGQHFQTARQSEAGAEGMDRDRGAAASALLAAVEALLEAAISPKRRSRPALAVKQVVESP